MAVALLAGGCSDGGKRTAAPTTTSTPPDVATTVASTTTTVGARPSGEHALVAFSSCSSLLRHVKKEALRVVTPYGLPSSPGGFGGRPLTADAMVTAEAVTGASAGRARTGAASPDIGAVPSADEGGGYSKTNIQEKDVDEPDVLKSDGRRLVTLAQGRLTVVDITAPSPRLLGTLALPNNETASELLLVGDRAVVLGHAWGRHGPGDVDVMSDSIARPQGSSTVHVVDLADPAKPTIVATMALEGQYVSARLASGVVRLVVEHDPKGPVFEMQPVARRAGDEARLLAANKEAIRKSRITDWLPTYTLEQPGQAKVTEPLAPCAAVLRPKKFAGLGTVSVLTIDPADPKPLAPACVLGGGRIVYAGTQNLYVASERWPDVLPDSSTPRTDLVLKTQLHRFSIAGREPAVYVASGEVEGTVLNQFSMSEHDGRLRVAVTTRQSDSRTESLVHVLEAQDGRLVTIGRVGNLGHEGETIHSVRFIGTRGYVVTFRQTDPLYVIDLADPRNPKVRGELQVPGFSSYLHPLTESVLLGVGQGPGDNGNPGLQLSLFDVADPAKPVRTAVKVFENGYSEAQHDHHAFLWWAPTKQLVLPFAQYEGNSTFTGAMALNVDPAAGFGPDRRISHPRGNGRTEINIRRAMVAGSRLLTLSQAGLLTSEMTTLAEQAWLPW